MASTNSGRFPLFSRVSFVPAPPRAQLNNAAVAEVLACRARRLENIQPAMKLGWWLANGAAVSLRRFEEHRSWALYPREWLLRFSEWCTFLRTKTKEQTHSEWRKPEIIKTLF